MRNTQHVSRYIHLNPVRAKMVEKPEGYKWSSYNVYLGKAQKPEGFEDRFLLGIFGRNRSEARKKYKEFVEDAVMNTKRILEEVSTKGVVIGGMEFFEEIRDKYIGAKEDSEIPQLREVKRMRDDEKIDTIKAEVGKIIKREKEQKKIMIYLIRRNTGYKLKEICDIIGGLTYSGVSQICRRVDRRLKKDRKFRAKIEFLYRKVSNVKT